MKNNWVSYLLKLIWFIGLVALAIIAFNLDNHIQQSASETFNLLPVIWTKLVISIIFGLYISLILVKKWSFKLNFSLLLCVAIPCLILSFAFPILASLSLGGHLPEILESSSISFELQKIFSMNVVGIIAGLSLILSLFNAQSGKVED
ncbi:hypothetical protein CEQ21_06580 [Niallia circulans]|uniref:Uncharacterized protein n=1 Tax=Niallia circulans TaxID=1397 RepID=A0A553SU97_NIACI|nr:hypothetical protein [Niallia circulans]TRZ40563.1 hypothetical protein CEQ21_06580 [Niallia circulans]